MKIMLFFFLLVPFLHSSNIDNLLQNYKQESELSKKTKDESAGTLIVYTRDDLERMQVESLDDILKSLRFFSYKENRLGQSDLLNSDPVSYYSKSIRVYLDDIELLIPIAGSGFIAFGNMEMDFIDHVEMYVGFPSFDFGIEPATILIRLYSKTAEHDEGGRVKANYGLHNSNKQNIYYSAKGEDLSYFVYANRSDVKKNMYAYLDGTLKRDKENKRFYGSLSSENHRLDLHVSQSGGDAFLGSFISMSNDTSGIPSQTYVDNKYINIATHSYFLDKSLLLNMSYTNSKTRINYEYSNPITLPSIGKVYNFNQIMDEEAFSTTLKKVWNFDMHKVTAGIQYRYKEFDLSDWKFNNIPNLQTSQVYSQENIFSFFLEDSISLNENNLITASFMSQIYKRDGNINDPKTIQLRFGYIYSNKDWVAKTFISKQEFVSEPYMTISNNYGNPNLGTETYSSIIQEFNYTNSYSISKFMFGYGLTEDVSILNPMTFKMQNAQEDLDAYFVSFEYTFLFSKKDKLELQANYSYIQTPLNIEDMRHYTYVLRMLNSINKFDIYNELVINTGYKNVPNAYNYSLGLKYHASKDLRFNIKADNIFDKALNQNYIYNINTQTQQIKNTTQPTLERKIIIGIEYLF